MFIAHKIQYASLSQLDNFAFVGQLLKGVDCRRAQIESIKPSNVIINCEVALGYKLRRDINKLFFMRRKRRAHNRRLYAEDMA